MKKTVLVILMAALLPHVSYGATETPLLPEVKKALEVPPLDEKEMAQNSYVYLLTIDAKDDNYFSIAKQHLIAYNQWLKGVTKDYYKNNLHPYPDFNYVSILDETINGQPYVFPFNILENPLSDSYSLTNMLANKQQTIVFINKNQKILTRYEQVISLPNYNPYIHSEGSSTQYLLFNVELLRAIYAIDEGNLEQGLALLQQQADFAKKRLVSTNLLLRNSAGNYLIREYRFVSDLLNAYPNLLKEPNLAKVKNLLNQLPNYDHNLKKAILNNRFSLLVEEITLTTNLNKQKDKSTLANDLRGGLNKKYLAYSPYIEFTQLTLPEIRDTYINNKSISDSIKCDKAENVAISNCNNNNQYVKYFSKDYEIETRNAFYTFFDVYNYLALVNLQLDILAKGLKAEQVPAFLVASGDKAINIITQKPFVWDKEKSTINTNYLTSGDSSRNPMAVKVNIK